MVPAASYYRATAASYAPYAALSGTQEAAIVIVGGGYAGLNTALGLAERGVRDVVLLEAEQIGHGASGRNGGFVFAGFSRAERELEALLGLEAARALYLGTVAAVDRIRQRIARYAIDCDAVDAGVIWANWFRDERVLRAKQAHLAEHYGVHWDWLTPELLQQRVRSARYRAGLFERNALHLHPLNYAIGLAGAAAGQGVRLHEHSRVSALERRGNRWHLQTAEGRIEARSVVLACGGYLAGLDQQIDRSVLPIATYAMATEPLGTRLAEILTTRAAVYDSRFAFDYYRPLNDTRLLWGGRISVAERSPAAVARLLKRDLLKVFPALADVRIDYAWSGLMSYARHQMPQIGQRADGVWYAQAFGGHGIAPTTLAGDLLSSALAEGDSRWQQFSHFGLADTWKPFGFAGAQASYWWHGLRDALKDLGEAR